MKKGEFMETAKRMTEKAMPYLSQTPPETMEETERQIIGAFLFGMYNALAFEKKAAPEEVQAITIERLKTILQYSLEQAVQFSGYLIDCTKEETNPNVYTIIHRGIDGYYQLAEGDEEGFRGNFEKIKEVLL